MRRRRDGVAAGRGLPHDHIARPVGRGEQRAIGAEGRGQDPVGVFGQIVELFAGLERVQPHHLLRPPKRHEPLVGAHVGGEHHVEFVAQRADAAAAFHVPDHDPAALGPDAAAGDHEAASAAEADHVRPALRERKHACEFKRVGAVEQDLLLAAYGDQRRPRARRERGAGVDGRGVHQGFERQACGQRRHGRPLRRRGRHGDLDLLGSDGHAPLGLEHTAVDPVPEHLPLRLGDRRRIGGHRRLVVVVGDAKEIAGRGVARRDHLARAAAPHDRSVARDIEAAGLLVGVVAAAAPLPEHGQGIVDERDLLLGRRRQRGDQRHRACDDDQRARHAGEGSAGVKQHGHGRGDQWLNTNSRELRIAQNPSSSVSRSPTGFSAAGSFSMISRSPRVSWSVGLRVSVRK